VYALDPTGGGTRWNFNTGAYYVMGSPAIDGDGTIYIGDSDGILHALTPAGQELWSYTLQSNIVSAPSIADDGAIYITCFDSALYAVTGRRDRRVHR
jgi:outer membrane protein assembly factor BamB